VWGPALGILVLAVVAALAVPRLRAALGVLVADARRAASPAVLGLSLLALAGYLGLFLVAARTAGVAAPVVELLPLLVLALFVMGLPVNVGAAQGLSTAVVYGVLTMVGTLPGGLVLALRRIRRHS
jgi:hypothetical protein